MLAVNLGGLPDGLEAQVNSLGKCKKNVYGSFIAFDMVDSHYRFVKSLHELYLQEFIFQNNLVTKFLSNDLLGLHYFI